MSEWLIAAAVAVSLMTPPMQEAQQAYDSQLRLEALAAIQCGPVGNIHECKVPKPVTGAPVTTAGGKRGQYHRPVPASVEHWRPLVEQHFAPADVPWAMRVMACESGGNPNAYNASSGASGLFQHLARYWRDRAAAAGWAGADVFDPTANVAVAAWLYYHGGPGHWVCR